VVFTPPRNMVYPALLPLMRTPRLPVVDRNDAPADLNGLVRFAKRRNLVYARVPSHIKRSLYSTFIGKVLLLQPRACARVRACVCVCVHVQGTAPAAHKICVPNSPTSFVCSISHLRRNERYISRSIPLLYCEAFLCTGVLKSP
jgi:hypothetical protein